MRVDESGLAFLPQQRGEIKRHEVATHGHQLPPPLRRKAQDGHESMEAPDFRPLFLRRARQLGAVNDRVHVIFPQALRQTLPPLAGQFVSLIKDSSLLSIIAITEFTWSAQAVNARTFSTLESYLPLAFGYLILTLPISLWTRRLERRHKYET